MPQPIEQQSGYLGHENIASATDVSSATLADLAASVRETRARRRALLDEYRRVGRSMQWTSCKAGLAYIATLGGLIFASVLPRLAARSAQLAAKRQALAADIEDEHLELDAELSDEARQAYERVTIAFERATKSARIWDIVTQAHFDRRVTRSYASTNVSRVPTRLEVASLEDLPVRGGLMCFRNRNGADLYLSPAFLAAYQAGGDVALLDLTHLSIEYSSVQFVETEGLPQDAQVVGHAWEKSNKDGSPDRRFAQNRQLPIAAYGELRLRSTTGLNECFLLSNERGAHALAQALAEYVKVAGA